jgi:hypothetical protein
LPPTSNGMSSSSVAMSKAGVVTATKVSSALMPGIFAMLVSRLTRLSCRIGTPFGRPVEPEVKIT